VDDSEPFRKALVALLAHFGYENVTPFDGAASAISYLNNQVGSHSLDVDVILMDLMMPEITGIEAIEQIQKNPQLRDIPIIVVSAQDEDTQVLQAFDSGATDFVNKPIRKLELRARVGSVLRLKEERDQRKAKEQELILLNERLMTLSRTDTLTGLSNRRAFSAIYEKEWERGLRGKSSLSVIMIDIDCFKRYNDHYGHVKGDQALAAVAKVIQENVNRPADVAVRYGGEEFLVLLPDTPYQGALSVARSIHQGVADLAIPHQESLVGGFLSISLGFYTGVPQDSESSESFITKADQNLYEAKKKGRNQVVSPKEN